MSVLTVSNNGTAAVPQTAAAVSNTVQTDAQALAAFAQALGQVVSFGMANSLPSLPGIFSQAAATQQNAAPAPVQSQSNDQPQQQNSAEPMVVQSGQNGQSQSQVKNVASNNGSAKAASGPSNNDNQTTTDSSANQSSTKVDPTSDQTVLAVVAGQIAQAPQAVTQVQTVVAEVTAGTQQQTAQTGPDTAQTGPTVPTGPVELQSKQAGPVVPTTNSGAQNQGAQQNNTQDDTWSLLQGKASDTPKTAGTKTVSTGGQTSVKDQQADDLARSLDGTGANLAVQVAVTSPTQSKPVDNSTQETTAQQPVLAGFDPLAPANSNGQPPTKDQSGGQDSTPVSTVVADTKAVAADQLVQNVQAFSAVLAAQLEAQPEQSPAPPPQGMSGVTAVTGTQATEETQSAQAPQAPTPTRTPQQAQVLDQVAVQISKQAKEGVDSISVKLNPQELGRIEIKLEVGKDGSVQATVTAENKDTLAMLQKDADSLAKALSDAGLSTDSSSMNFNLRSDGQQQQFAGDANSQNNGNSGGGRSRWAAMKNSVDADAGATPVVQSSSGGLSAVDLRV